MKTKEKGRKRIKITLKGIILSAYIFFVIVYILMFYKMYIGLLRFKTEQVTAEPIENIKISNAEDIDIEEILQKNANESETTEVTQEEAVLEYLTQYRTNTKIPKGVSYVIQEGRYGTQKITIERKYVDGELTEENQISATVVKASSNKIVEIGGGSYTSNYKVKVGDTIYVTSDELALRDEPTEESRKITTLKQNNELKVIALGDNWYKVKIENMTGWVKSECTTYINNNTEQNYGSGQDKSKTEAMGQLSFGMSLNKPSGLSLEQFKKVLTDSKDKNKIFEKNAEYFYYIEQQYSINGIFVAAVGIHESGWGASQLALNKNNLFGYGAYDSNPYNGAYDFGNYSESIDLLARVFVKYYLNPSGTSIYGGEKAAGTYYNGATLSGINVKYASDKNWANDVFSHMKYLYNKL